MSDAHTRFVKAMKYLKRNTSNVILAEICDAFADAECDGFHLVDEGNGPEHAICRAILHKEVFID